MLGVFLERRSEFIHELGDEFFDGDDCVYAMGVLPAKDETVLDVSSVGVEQSFGNAETGLGGLARCEASIGTVDCLLAGRLQVLQESIL